MTGAPPNQQGSGPDRSMADFFWCMMVSQRGWSIEDTANKLMEVSARAQQRLGTHVTQSCDTVLNVCNSFGYDEFNRLSARTVTQGTVQNFTYSYDQYGTRWKQNAPQGGPTLIISFNAANNIINTSGFANDAVGNVTSDTFHSYTYDAEGNLTSVDAGQTASYYYDSLNQRVRIAPTLGTYSSQTSWEKQGTTRFCGRRGAELLHCPKARSWPIQAHLYR